MGFTLIELLIVVAIIAILAAIAVPNFLEAQVRSKVSRTRADMRTVGVALESYRMDEEAYPPARFPGGTPINWHERLIPLTSPVAYLTSYETLRDIFNTDPFHPKNGGTHYGEELIYFYRDRGSDAKHYPGDLYIWDRSGGISYGTSWFLLSWGPDKRFTTYYDLGGDILSVDCLYDATNGTKSWGDIYRHGPDK